MPLLHNSMFVPECGKVWTCANHPCLHRLCVTTSIRPPTESALLSISKACSELVTLYDLILSEDWVSLSPSYWAWACFQLGSSRKIFAIISIELNRSNKWNTSQCFTAL